MACELTPKTSKSRSKTLDLNLETPYLFCAPLQTKVTPFASNASELVSSLQFAKKKKIKNISLTYSQVYGAITMNNTMCLGLFLLVVWYRKLDWTFSSEVGDTPNSTFFLCNAAIFLLPLSANHLSSGPIASYLSLLDHT